MTILPHMSPKARISSSRSQVTQFLVVAMPAVPIIANASNENGEMLEDSVPPPGDVEFDLSLIADIIEDYLPQAQDGDEGGDDQ